MTGRVVCFGELLLRMSPQLGGDWLRTSSMPVFVGGAEANVATALAKWEIPTGYCTALPDNSVSHQVLDYLEQKDIDTHSVRVIGNRIGLYFLPTGADLKNAGVIYDRAGSSFADLRPGDIDWAEVLKDADWFHFSAICPAISKNVADLCEQALIAARKLGVRISLDLNYREKLWKYGLRPVDIMPRLARYCDVIMGNIWAAEKMLGIRTGVPENAVKKDYIKLAELASASVSASYPQCKLVANTFRFSWDQDQIDYYATLYQDGQLYQSREYHAESVRDRAGSGDCFMAGLIYGSLKKLGPQKTIDFATSAAFQKLFIPGDSTTMTVQEILQAIDSNE